MININGTANVIKELRKYGDDVKRLVIAEVEETTTNIEIRAIRNKHMKLSFITIDKLISNGGLRGVVGIQGDNKLAAYFEFGTGISAKWILGPYPQEVKDVAMQFFETGEGTLRGQPFLYPAWLSERIKFITALEKVLEVAVQNYKKRN